MEIMLGRPVIHHSPAHLGKKKKVEKVMHEYAAGDLRSSSGQKVTDHDQAVAIAMSEAGMSRKRKGRR